MDYVLSHGLYVPEIWLEMDLDWLEVRVDYFSRVQPEDGWIEDSKLLKDWAPLRIKELKTIRLIMGDEH